MEAGEERKEWELRIVMKTIWGRKRKENSTTPFQYKCLVWIDTVFDQAIDSIQIKELVDKKTSVGSQKKNWARTLLFLEKKVHKTDLF